MQRRCKRLLVAAALAGIQFLAQRQAHAAILTWDSSAANPGAPIDGNGNWDTGTANWANAVPNDVVWDNLSTAQFGAGNGTGNYIVTIDDGSGTVSAAGVNFNSAGTANYTVAAASDTLTLTSPTITVAAGVSPTISAPITGSVGLTMAGSGALTLTGANNYTGGTAVTGGTLIVNAGGTLGAAANALTMGSLGGSLTDTTPVTVNLNTNTTMGALTVNVNSSTANVLTVASGSKVTVNGAASVGLGSATSATNTVLNSYTGTNVPGSGGELDINGNFTVGVANTNATSTKNATTVDLSALSKFTMTSTSSGTLNIGNGQNTLGKLTLASGSGSSNIINVTTITVGASGSSNANAGCQLNLGSGSNTIEAGTINIGTGKSSGVMQFVSGAPASASVAITGINGVGTADITIGRQTSGTATSNANSLLLAGHSATVNTEAVVVGALAGATGGTALGAITFDTGTFTVGTTLSIGVDSSGNDTGGVNGTFTVGGATPNNTATGTLDVSGAFNIGNVSSTSTTTKTDAASLIINGGTVNSHLDITSIKVSGATNTTLASTLSLLSGTLNMNGNQIGHAVTNNKAISVINLPTAGKTATLLNLGGTGINDSGLTMNGAGGADSGRDGYLFGRHQCHQRYVVHQRHEHRRRTEYRLLRRNPRRCRLNHLTHHRPSGWIPRAGRCHRNAGRRCHHAPGNIGHRSQRF